MVKSDLINRENGLIQWCERACGLGPTGITGNPTVYSDFVGWLNQYNNMGASIAIMAWNGADFDDIGYGTQPSGRLVGTLNRDYNVDESYKLLKFKTVAVSYDGINIVRAKPIDVADKLWIAKNDPNVDTWFSTSCPKFDERAMGFDLYPKFTAAQVALGAFIDIEWFRAPRAWDTTSTTDTYEPSLELQFHHFPAVGASYEYSKLYKPELAVTYQGDLFGVRTARGILIKPGIIGDIEAWYNAKNRLNSNVHVSRRVRR